MDNNQQLPTVVQPAAATPVTREASPGTTPDGAGLISPNVTNLGVNQPKVMAGDSVQSPLSGNDVSMTTGQAYGGPIVTTEIPNVTNQTGPNA